MNTNETKRTPAIAATIHGEVLTLQFSDGRILDIDSDELSEEVVGYATMHGLKQKLVDAAAISRNPENGRAATVDDKYNAVKAVFDRLVAGQWNASREGGTAGGLLFRALCLMYEGRRTVGAVREFLVTKSDAEKTALRKNPKVAAIIDTLRAETAGAGGVDTEAMLDELGE